MRLVEYLPQVWDASAEVIAIQEALEPAVAAAWAARDGLLDQLNVSSATWGLEAWERALGIEVDVSRPAEYRRTRVMSKLRGQGATTAAMIQNVSESFSNGAVEVAERPELYRFDIKFVGTVGIPPNMEDLTAAIEEIKPAHLGYDYIIIYRTWGQIERLTWDEVGMHTWDEVLGGEIA